MWFLKFQMKMRFTVACLHHSFSMSSMFQWFLLEKNIYEIKLWNIVKKQLKQGIGKKTCFGPRAAWTRAPSVRWARRIITLILSSRFLRNISHPMKQLTKILLPVQSCAKLVLCKRLWSASFTERARFIPKMWSNCSIPNGPTAYNRLDQQFWTRAMWMDSNPDSVTHFIVMVNKDDFRLAASQTKSCAHLCSLYCIFFW